MKTAIKSHCTHWLLFALALMDVEAEARPVHWLSWRQGVVRSVDPQRNVLTMAGNNNQAAEVFRWNKETRFFNQATERGKSGGLVDPGALASGQSVKILFQNQRGEKVAKRIVINCSHHELGSKTVQSAWLWRIAAPCPLIMVAES